MNAWRLAWMLAVLLSLPASALMAPIDEAYRRVEQTFSQRAPLPLDDAVINGRWAPAPFEMPPYIYTHEDIRERWPRFMRGLLLPFPSAQYLKTRYQRFPALFRDLRYQDDDWAQHSRNVLEVWQAFFRGDFRLARDLGRYYGGYARVPAVVAQIMYATYLAPTHTQKQQLLQEAINDMAWFARQAPLLPGDKAMQPDYCMLRLGFGYAVARLAEDESVPASLQRNYAAMVINAATEILAVEPDHPLALSLGAAFEANVLRRVGKTAGRLAMEADSRDAILPFERSVEQQPTLAIVRYEYANSLLYIHQEAQVQQAVVQLMLAARLPANNAMEWLDRAYARKRLQEIQAWQASGMTFRRFDRKRRKYMSKEDRNLYAVNQPPFLVD